MNLREIVFSDNREINFIESSNIGGVICPLIRLRKDRIYLYGCGQDTYSYINFFRNNGIEIAGIIDKDKQKNGMAVDGITCISISDAHKKRIGTDNDIAIITTSFFEGYQQQEIVNSLLEIGISKFYVPDNNDRLIVVGSDWGEEFHGRIKYYREHINQLEKTFKRLLDDESRETMKEYIRLHTECGIYSRVQIDGRYKYFFGKESEGKAERIWKNIDNEIWLNCGAGIGDSIFLYFSNGLKAETVYAYEANERKFKSLCYNLEFLPPELKKKVIPINEYIDETTIFGDDKNRITFINADIEGNELALLHSLSSVIKECRPVISLCVYHKKDDLVAIPEYIDSITENYATILRKYAGAIKEDRKFSELVMYFVPQERLEVFENER